MRGKTFTSGWRWFHQWCYRQTQGSPHRHPHTWQQSFDLLRIFLSTWCGRKYLENIPSQPGNRTSFSYTFDWYYKWLGCLETRRGLGKKEKFGKRFLYQNKKIYRYMTFFNDILIIECISWYFFVFVSLVISIACRQKFDTFFDKLNEYNHPPYTLITAPPGVHRSVPQTHWCHPGAPRRHWCHPERIQ